MLYTVVTVEMIMHPYVQVQVAAILKNDLYRSMYSSFRKLCNVDSHVLIKIFKEEIERDHIRNMNPEALGTLLCALKTSGTSMNRAELIHIASTAYDHEEMLRQIATSSLAHIIWRQLEPEERSIKKRSKLTQFLVGHL